MKLLMTRKNDKNNSTIAMVIISIEGGVKL